MSSLLAFYKQFYIFYNTYLFIIYIYIYILIHCILIFMFIYRVKCTWQELRNMIFMKIMIIVFESRYYIFVKVHTHTKYSKIINRILL